ncbi:SPFH domain / Band 7 family protein [Pseudomonas sp. NFACC23-1]|uniref:SPFH domain-containing protein n=1 Tax=unclassified Pseudomonas TaxID=196821 RepID=UPI0008922454|nr:MULTISPECIES: SPFH domain-containing protein [unclassified Pseudomonas]SDB33667.1 SPFH domain / Band 7 family protein [Pseudomonas sp. NFACC17-2]SEJ49684.1 SPFH domain / Band 7 family protein [Pseudomonas sp. NFACC23-1]SFW70308.1 SPFH domain / Band 7 family protein [Pseudomonas sp. NFACC16-2]
MSLRRFYKQWGLCLIAALVAYLFAWESFYTVNEQDRGVILRNGKVLTEAQPGMGWKIPLADQLISLSMQNNLLYWKAFQARTQSDLMELEVSIVWRIAPSEATTMYKKYTTLEALENTLLIPKATEQIRLTLSGYDTEQALKNRQALINSISKSIRTTIDGPIIIERIYIGNVHMQSISIE